MSGRERAREGQGREREYELLIEWKPKRGRE